ncbi:SGNH/GDSL hydrolase family protein [Symmachiella dynata]|uniref:SGNH/GDSL hydrolase family protein n=1 Tax=Symmachiella dynata TaxID=2527995 RepID=UPI0030EF8978
MIRTRLADLKHLIYAVLALLILVVLGEVGLRVYDSYTGQITRSDIFDQGIVHRSWTTHHALKPSETQQSPTVGETPGVTVRINSLGLRGDEIVVPKPPGVYRIVCLGDERTLATEVPEEETFTGQLEALLQQYTRQRVEVVNAGVPGYCPLLSYLQVKHQLAALQADVFVMNFDMSDVADDYHYRRMTAMSRDGLPLNCTHPKLLPAPNTGASPDCELLLLLQWGKRTASELVADNIGDGEADNISVATGRYAWLKDDPPDWSPYIEQSMEPLQQLKTLTRGLFADLIVAAGPVPWQICPTASGGEALRNEIGVPVGTHCASRRPFQILADYCQQETITMCDTSPAFQASDVPATLFQEVTLGYSREGHRLYARELAKRILRNSAGIWERPQSSSNSQPAPQATTHRDPRSTSQ